VDLEEREGVEPVIELVCAECGTALTQAEIEASLETGGGYLCTVHAQMHVALSEEDDNER
jgi:hypothetical protein